MIAVLLMAASLVHVHVQVRSSREH